MYIPEFE